VSLVSLSFPCLVATILSITKRAWMYRPLLTGRHIESVPQREGTSALMRLPVRDVHHSLTNSTEIKSEWSQTSIAIYIRAMNSEILCF